MREWHLIDKLAIATEALQFIASARRKDGKYDKHDMAGAVITAERALARISEVKHHDTRQLDSYTER